jgi:hypothetical protein
MKKNHLKKLKTQKDFIPCPKLDERTRWVKTLKPQRLVKETKIPKNKPKANELCPPDARINEKKHPPIKVKKVDRTIQSHFSI